MAAKTRTERSIETLKELHSAAVALALYVGIGGLAWRSDGALVIHLEYFWWFLAFFITLLPFYHGAIAHLDEAYIFASERPRNFAFLVEYLILFCEAGLLVWLGLLVSKPDQFVRYYALLLGVDVLWAACVYFLTPATFEKVKRWLVINIAALIAIGLVSYTPLLDKAKPGYLVWVACMRSVLDYVWSWKTYFPEEAPGSIETESSS